MTLRLRSLAFLILCSACTGRDVVAKVGSREIKVSDVNALVSTRAVISKPDPSAALAQLIDRELLAEGARRAGVADDPAIAARLHGLEREVLAQAMIDKEMKAVDETALKKRYDEKRDTLKTREIHVAQIFITMGKDIEVAESKASAAYARLVGGDAFDSVAGDVSDDKPSASRGGDLGKVREGQVNQDFFAVAVALKAGEMSKPFRTEYGLHIIKAIEDPTEFVPTFEEVRGRLLADARREIEAALRTRLASEITVKRYPEHMPDAGR